MVVTSIFTSFSDMIRGSVTDETHLYTISDSAINKTSLTDSTSTTSYPFSSSYATVAVDNTYVYILSPNSGELNRMNKDTGAIDIPFLLTVEGNTLRINGNKLYITNPSGGKIGMLNITTNVYTSGWLTGGLDSPRGMTFVNNDMYISGLNSIIKVIINSDGSGTIDTSFVCSLPLGDDLHPIVNDGTFLYVTNRSSGEKISKIKISTSEIINAAFASFPSLHIRGVSLINNKVYVSGDSRDIYVFDIIQPLTEIYLGKIVVTDAGTIDFASSIPSTSKIPTDPHHLVPKAYVDTYNENIVAYLTKVLDGNGLNDILTRLSLVEEQLDRSYKAIWNRPRDTALISTELNPELRITGNLQDAINATMIANVPSAPTDIGTGFTV